MSQDTRKSVFGVIDQVRHNRAVQSQKMARGLKFWKLEAEGLYYLCSKNNGTADPCFCFRICEKPGFLWTRLIC